MGLSRRLPGVRMPKSCGRPRERYNHLLMTTPRILVKDATSEASLDGVPAEPSPPRTYECDHCACSFEGTPGGAGLLIWTRGDEVRYEEPPLCEECASKITIGALLKWDVEEEEEG